MRKAGQYGVSREDTGWENSNAGKCRIRKLSQTPPTPQKEETTAVKRMTSWTDGEESWR